MLIFDSVQVLYGKKTVLENVNARIQKGRVTVLVGKNGSGKSSLLSCLIGQTAYKGAIFTDGEDLSALSPRERAKRLTLLPQILPETALTVEQLCFLGRNPYLSLGGKYKAEDKKAVEEALTLTQMHPLHNRPVNRLSGGERQRAFLAAALAQQSPMLALDEPTSYLDPAQARHFLQCVRSLADEQQKTVLLVLHDMNAAMETADDVLCLDNGTCIFSGTKQDFLHRDLPKTVFGLQSASLFDENGSQRTVFY